MIAETLLTIISLPFPRDNIPTIVVAMCRDASYEYIGRTLCQSYLHPDNSDIQLLWSLVLKISRVFWVSSVKKKSRSRWNICVKKVAIHYRLVFTLYRLRLDDLERVSLLLKMTVSDMVNSISQSGHQYAMCHSASSLTELNQQKEVRLPGLNKMMLAITRLTTTASKS